MTKTSAIVTHLHLNLMMSEFTTHYINVHHTIILHKFSDLFTHFMINDSNYINHSFSSNLLCNTVIWSNSAMKHYTTMNFQFNLFVYSDVYSDIIVYSLYIQILIYMKILFCVIYLFTLDQYPDVLLFPHEYLQTFLFMKLIMYVLFKVQTALLVA